VSVDALNYLLYVAKLTLKLFECRYCLTVTIIGFVYSGFQAYDLSYHLATGKHVIKHHLRHQFDFISDQASIIADSELKNMSVMPMLSIPWQQDP